MKIIPNFLRNSGEIVEFCEMRPDKFKPRIGADKHESIIPGLCSQFSTWHSKDMPDYIIDLIFEDADFDPFLKDTYSFIQIQRYLKGDYIVPHKDVYDITKLHLITLTHSNSDGLVCEVDGKLEKFFDTPGSYIDFPRDAFHWVDPVYNTRYSLVVGE